jgi:prepilin-type processing-associated H-X9-DG protein
MLARLTALFVLLASPVLALGQALSDRVPADAIVYVGWTGSESLGPKYKGSNLESVLAESNIPAVFEQFLPEVFDKVAKENPDAAEPIKIFRTIAGPMWRHPSAFAFLGVDLQNPNGPRPHALLISQAGKDAAALQKQVDDLLKGQGQPPFPVQVVRVGDLVALTVGYDKGEDALAGGPNGPKALTTNPNFTKALAQVDKDAVITGYIDVAGLLNVAGEIAKNAPQEAQDMYPKVKDALGLEGIHQVIWTEGFDGKQWGTRAFIAAPEPHPGLLGALMQGKPISNDVLKAIPQNATIAAAGRFDLGGFISAVRTAVGKVDPGAQQQFDQVVDQVNQTVGLDVQKDLLANLGDEWAYYTDPAVAGKGLLGITLVNRLKDPAKAEGALTKLEDFINKFAAEQLKDQQITVTLRQSKVGGMTIHYLAIPAITPAWAIQDGNLYVGLFPEVVASAAAQVSGKGKSILDNPAFVAMRDHIGGTNKLSGVSFMDLQRLAPDSYPSWLVVSRLIGIGDMMGIRSPIMVLPPLNKLMPYLAPAGQASWSDAEGIHVRAISPFPGSEIFGSDPGGMTMAQQAMVASIMLPALNKARGQANHVKSGSNLRQIGLAAMLYANDKNGAFPKDLGELLETQDLTVQVFVNPASTTAVPAGLTPKQQAQWVKENSDYVWNGAGKKNTAGAGVPLAWEKPETATDGINILFGDGHVEFQAMPQAMETIQKAQQQSPEPGKARRAPPGDGL